MLLADVGADLLEWGKLLGLVVGGGGLVQLFNTWWTNRRTDRTDEVARLSGRLDVMEKNHDTCQQLHLECQKENIELRAQINDQNRRLVVLEGNLITAAITCDSSMKITEWNEGATLMFGHLRSDVLGLSVDILIPGYLRQQHYNASSAAINDLDAVTNTERDVVAMRKDGLEFPVHLKLSSFRNNEGAKFFSARITRPRPE